MTDTNDNTHITDQDDNLVEESAIDSTEAENIEDADNDSDDELDRREAIRALTNTVLQAVLPSSYFHPKRHSVWIFFLIIVVVQALHHIVLKYYA